MPMIALAPARFSTTTFCLRSSDSAVATMRATMSTLPPAANGTTTFSGLSGKAPLWAMACAQHSAASRGISRVMRIVRLLESCVGLGRASPGYRGGRAYQRNARLASSDP